MTLIFVEKRRPASKRDTDILIRAYEGEIVKANDFSYWSYHQLSRPKSCLIYLKFSH